MQSCDTLKTIVLYTFENKKEGEIDAMGEEGTKSLNKQEMGPSARVEELVLAQSRHCPPEAGLDGPASTKSYQLRSAGPEALSVGTLFHWVIFRCEVGSKVVS